MNLRALQQFTDEIFGRNRHNDSMNDYYPHQTGELCADCLTDPSQRSYDYGDMTTLTHERQVAIFGWCSCEDNEDNENPYLDCPTQGENQ